MNRRGTTVLILVVLMGGVAVGLTGIALAQEVTRLRQIVLLMAYKKADLQTQKRVSVFRQGLRELDWIDGQNVRIDVRWLEGKTERANDYAKKNCR